VRVAPWVFLLLLPCGASPLEAQQVELPVFVPPIAGSWEPVKSLGQPRRLKPFFTLGFGVERTSEGRQAGPTGSMGLFYDLFSPVYGALALSAEGYLGQRGERIDRGMRVHLESPAVFLRTGADWNARLGRVDLSVGTSFPVTRGGVLRRGGEFRLDWVTGPQPRLTGSISLPLGQPLAGRTRPRAVDVPLPRPPGVRLLPPPGPGTRTRAAVDELSESMRWLVALHNFFWLTDFQSLGYEDTVRDWRDALAGFRAELDRREAVVPQRDTYAREVEHYHRTLDRAFGLVYGGASAGAAARGREVADRARRIVLEEMVLPYNRTIGRYKKPDVLDGLAARARARFIAWLALGDAVEVPSDRELLRVFDAWLDDFEQLRAQIAALTGDSRMHWLPLALVLRPEEHEDQARIDALIELGLGRPFTDGNATLYINAVQFQAELERSIHEADRYHVLWIHDYRGSDGLGNVDRTGFSQTTRGYLRALLERVRTYDETGRLPVYVIMLDQHFYELNDGRRWMTLLERPLTHRVRFPPGHETMDVALSSLQDSLRKAVAGSRRLQAEAEAFGPEWIERVVKVHVNITNPSDFSFRSRRLLGPPIGADNLLRDHRKIVIRDVTEGDPAAGEVILAGVGVGDHYATSTWEDRGLILQGPAALEARAMARRVLERHGLGGDDMPYPLRQVPGAPDHAALVRALEEAGATARVLQAHNRTGWDDKDATFVQMLLYDLVPAGTVLYVPDSLWTSYEWMSQLVSAALRGCRVYVVAPALENAPSAGFPQMSTMQELITRLVLVQERFGDVIAQAGGELRVGLYARTAPLDDLPSLVREMRTTFDRHSFLQRLFPLDDAAWEALRAREETTPSSEGVVEDVLERRPKLHRKTQLIAPADVLEGLARTPAFAEVLDGILSGLSEGLTRPSESGPIVQQARARSHLALVRLHDELPLTVRDRDGPTYFLTGSINKNVRSLALDGEALAVVAGPWALQAYVDFLLFSGGVHWVEGIDDVERLLPPYSSLRRWIGRLLHRVL
jgi:hypothetical protein